MKIIAGREKKFVELLPTIAFGWYGDKTLYFAWLFWNVFIIW